MSGFGSLFAVIVLVNLCLIRLCVCCAGEQLPPLAEERALERHLLPSEAHIAAAQVPRTAANYTTFLLRRFRW